MDNAKYLIIGGGPAGTAAAQAIRALDIEASIAIIDLEGRPLYSKLLLHKFIAGEIPQENLSIKKPDWYRDNKIYLIQDDIVDVKSGLAILKSGRTIEFQKILLSSGSKARNLDAGGRKGLFALRNLTDAIAIKEYLQSSSSVCVVGGGLIATDVLDGLLNSGRKISLVIRDKFLLDGKIHPKGSELLEKLLIEKGTSIYRQDEVSKFGGGDRIENLTLKSGQTIGADLVIVGVGVEADFGYLKETLIETNRGILVNEEMRTSVGWAFSAGDVCEHPVKGFDAKTLSGNWIFGQASGKTAGTNMAGGDEVCDVIPVSTKSLGGISIGYFGDYLQGSESVDIEKDNSFIKLYLLDGKVCSASVVGNMSVSKNIRSMIGGEFDQSKL